MEAPSRVVFVTAHDELAVAAFVVNAMDYLLKLVDPERLGSALDRAVPVLAMRKDSDKITPTRPMGTHPGAGSRGGNHRGSAGPGTYVLRPPVHKPLKGQGSPLLTPNVFGSRTVSGRRRLRFSDPLE